MQLLQRHAVHGLVALFAGFCTAIQAAPLGPAFTFQGRLTPTGGGPAPATVNLEFRLFDAATLGNQIGNPDVENNTPLTNGLFSVTLNDTNQFGATAFNGQTRWIEVRVNGVPLVPRHLVTAAPYARYSLAGKPGYSLDASDGLPTDVVYVDAIGNVGIRSTLPATELDVRSNGSATAGQVRAANIAADTWVMLWSGFTNGSNDPAIIWSDDVAGDDLRFLISSAAGSGGAELMRITGTGNVGIGTPAPAEKLHMVGTVRIDNSAAVQTININGDESGGATIKLFNSAGVQTIKFDADETDAPAIHLTNEVGVETLLIDGNNGLGGSLVKTQILQITGGSDLSEQFDVLADGQEPQPGMVVCIDPENAGKLAVCSRKHDRAVAGVISGAGGVKSGMLMGQADTIATGQHAVALTGRVYVRCDASFGTIQPGDLMTTSPTPGHAMKVTDSAAAQGAVLGKSMTALVEGQGLVLVLVSLQ
jgi:hypothetical protein